MGTSLLDAAAREPPAAPKGTQAAPPAARSAGSWDPLLPVPATWPAFPLIGGGLPQHPVRSDLSCLTLERPPRGVEDAPIILPHKLCLLGCSVRSLNKLLM